MGKPTPPRVPLATYRLQFNRELTFADAAALVEYLHALGISDLYASPIFKAREGSLHGYDVLDHDDLNPELGGEEGLSCLAARLRERGMGIVLDLVPNHMCIASPENRRWTDLLENGPASASAAFFDVDWDPPKADLKEKVLLPVLGDQYGRVLEGQELQVVREGGAFQVAYYEHRFPLAPKSWPTILAPARELARAVLGEADDKVLELESILTAIAHLPPRSERNPARIQERYREKEIVKKRLGALLEASDEVRGAVDAVVSELNGRRGEPRSFDRLEALLSEQGYRLSHWRVASDEINYRRFFDINELAAVRVEEPAVFEALHALPLRLVEQGVVSGFRIDHVDGLYDPADYLGRLPPSLYTVVEKIVGPGEELRPEWSTHGTTGYGFLNLLGALFVDRAGLHELKSAYARFTGRHDSFPDVIYECKKLALEVALSAELTVLARRLDRISEQHRYSRDFTLNSQQEALAEVIACFPVYRTYVRAEEAAVGPEDRRHIRRAIQLAKRRNPAISASLFDFVASVLLLEHPEGLDEAARRERVDFVMRFQQLTGPVTAKGLEDTAAYRHHPLLSLNEVGGEGDLTYDPLEAFHELGRVRVRSWPHAMSASSTHDTKRDEDVRARLQALSEVPEAWAEALVRWRELNRPLKAVVDDAPAPDANEEYLVYQTLLGAWPPGAPDGPPDEAFVGRIQAYLRKALREAKLHTSWVSPNEAYEAAVSGFVAKLLRPAPGQAFMTDFLSVLRALIRPGLLNAVSQALLKVAAPGVPDFYQGTELPEFRLVDPDNRAPVDFERRARLLADLDAETARRGAASVADRLLAELDGLKLFVISRALRFRRANPALFQESEYHPLAAAGARARHVVAFARAREGRAVVAAAARFFTPLPSLPTGRAAWGATTLRLPPELPARWRDVLTGRETEAARREGASELSLAEAFAHLPVALLEGLS
jgi:(1->4)-alpha-D-glucan 1-alpha-D-glucosylmutase